MAVFEVNDVLLRFGGAAGHAGNRAMPASLVRRLAAGDDVIQTFDIRGRDTTARTVSVRSGTEG